MTSRKVTFMRDSEWQDLPEPIPFEDDHGDGDMAWLGALIVFASGVSSVALLVLWGVYQTIGLYLACGALVGILDALSGKRVWAGVAKLAFALPAFLVGLRLMGVGA